MTKLKEPRPNASRRAALRACMHYGCLTVQRENDPRLKCLMGLVELGELAFKEVPTPNPGRYTRRFQLTRIGEIRAEVLNKKDLS